MSDKKPTIESVAIEFMNIINNSKDAAINNKFGLSFGKIDNYDFTMVIGMGHMKAKLDQVLKDANIGET